MRSNIRGNRILMWYWWAVADVKSLLVTFNYISYLSLTT